jgi:hypothetical protein
MDNYLINLVGNFFDSWNLETILHYFVEIVFLKKIFLHLNTDNEIKKYFGLLCIVHLFYIFCFRKKLINVSDKTIKIARQLISLDDIEYNIFATG